MSSQDLTDDEAFAPHQIDQNDEFNDRDDFDTNRQVYASANFSTVTSSFPNAREISEMLGFKF